MKILDKINWLPTAVMVAVLSIFSSCENDDEGGTNQVELLSFGPAGVHHGDPVVFIGNNLDKVTSVELTGVTVTSDEFVEHTKEHIVVVVPEEAEEGIVILKTPDGDLMSKTVLSFEVPVTVTSMTAEAKPGTNITLTGEFMNWVKEVRFANDVVVTTFISRSLDELVVQVPLEAQTGRVTLVTGGTEPLEIAIEEDLILTLPVITGLSPNPVERGANVTITGSDLDLVSQVLFKGDVTIDATDFVSHTDTEIVVTVPEAANQGKVSLVTFSAVNVESENPLQLVGALPPLDPLGLAFYVDGLENGWQKWGGWGGGSSDIDNASNVRDGEKAIKVIFDADWGGPFQLGGGNSSTAGFTELVVSIYGDAGTDGNQLNVLIAGKEKIVTIIEGEWTEFKIPLADVESPAVINEFTFQARGWAGTIYADHIGLR